MVGYLAHRAVDHEPVRAVADARHTGKHFDHELALEIPGDGAMVSEDRHRRTARIAIKDREAERMSEMAIVLRVLAKLT